MDDKERSRALELTLGQIEKQFGKGSILRLGSKDAIVPVTVISTDATENRRSRMFALGARGYICKPFQPEALRAELEKTLGAPNA